VAAVIGAVLDQEHERIAVTVAARPRDDVLLAGRPRFDPRRGRWLRWVHAPAGDSLRQEDLTVAQRDPVVVPADTN
jgi:hypothetical protein